MKAKVFCIGFHKTGTSSLGLALAQLGYRVTGVFGVNTADIAEQVHRLARDRVRRFDAFQDNPWPILYRELDSWVPGARFILTRRNIDKWYISANDHFGEKSTPMREWIYGPGKGAPSGNEDLYKARYQRHYDEVLTYFNDRPQDLLIMDLERNFCWPDLCAFLNLPIPDAPFPRANTIALRQRRDKRIKLSKTQRRTLGLD